MNKKKQLMKISAIIFVLTILCGGCYRYTPAPVAYDGNVFSSRERDGQDDLLKDVKILDLATAQEIAVKNNPSYIAAYHAVNAARMRYYQALNAYLPEFTLGFDIGVQGNENYNRHNVSQTRSRSFTTQTNLNASWLIFDGFIRYMTVMQNRQSWEAQKNLEEDARRLLMQSVAYAFNDILLARGQRAIAKADMEFQLKNLEQTQLKLEYGTVPLSDVLNFKILSNNAIGDQLSAEYSYNVAVYSLAVLMGYPDGKLPEHIDFPPINADTNEHVSTVEVYLDIALNNRPDLQYYRDQVKINEYSLYSAYGAYSPTIYANAGFGFGTNAGRSGSERSIDGGGTHNSYANTPSWSAGVSAQWVLPLEWKRAARIKEVQADIAAAQFTVANTWLQVVEEVRTAYDNYIQSVRLARLYVATLELVTKQRELVEEEYNAGNTEITRLNEAQLNYVQAENTMINSLVSVQKAIAQLRATTHTSPIGARVEQAAEQQNQAGDRP